MGVLSRFTNALLPFCLVRLLFVCVCVAWIFGCGRSNHAHSSICNHYRRQLRLIITSLDTHRFLLSIVRSLLKSCAVWCSCSRSVIVWCLFLDSCSLFCSSFTPEFTITVTSLSTSPDSPVFDHRGPCVIRQCLLPCMFHLCYQ